MKTSQFSVRQIEDPLGGSSKKGSHVDSCYGTTIVTSDCTIVTSGHHGSIETTFISNNSTIWQNKCFPENMQQEVYMTTFFATAP